MSGQAPPPDDDAFAAALAALGPFEDHPQIAVAWSGGGDSTALLALARDWARARGGAVVALHIDHGLRTSSAGEARELAARAGDFGVEFECLRWEGAKPATGIMDAARAARRDLLTAACRRRGVFHLLLAHHDDDQRETVSLRAARGSGPAGRAGMSAISDAGGVRLLRPLLGRSHRELLGICRARGLAWIEDPSNADPRFARARLRAGPAAPPVDPHAAARRVRDEAALAELAARAAAIAPGGYLRLDRAAMRGAPEALAARLLARAVLCAGGDDYAPSPDAAQAAWVALRDADPGTRGRTLGHCRLRVEPDGSLLVAREVRACAPPVELTPGARQIWDGRFAVAVDGSAFGLEIGALGAAGWASLPREVRAAAAKSVPAAARASLPAVRDLDGVVLVPHLFYGRPGHSLDTVAVLFRPRHRLTGPAFVADRPAL